MKILPQVGDLVRPVFLELVQTTGTDTTYCRTTYGCGLQPMVVIPVFAKNGKYWKNWKILPKMVNTGNWQSGRLSAKTVLAVGAPEC